MDPPPLDSKGSLAPGQTTDQSTVTLAQSKDPSKTAQTGSKGLGSRIAAGVAGVLGGGAIAAGVVMLVKGVAVAVLWIACPWLLIGFGVLALGYAIYKLVQYFHGKQQEEASSCMKYEDFMLDDPLGMMDDFWGLESENDPRVLPSLIPGETKPKEINIDASKANEPPPMREQESSDDGETDQWESSTEASEYFDGESEPPRPPDNGRPIELNWDYCEPLGT